MVEGERGEDALEAAVGVRQLRGGRTLELNVQTANGDLPPRIREDAVVDVNADEQRFRHHLGGEQEERARPAPDVEHVHPRREVRALDHAQFEAPFGQGKPDAEVVERSEGVAAEGGDEGSVVRHRDPRFRKRRASRSTATETSVVCSGGTLPMRTNGMVGISAVYDQMRERTAMNSITAAMSGAAVRTYAHVMPLCRTNQSGR